jgi:hypothetical protein
MTVQAKRNSVIACSVAAFCLWNNMMDVHFAAAEPQANAAMAATGS